MASHITSLMIVYSTVYSGTDQRKHHSSASVAFVNSPVTGEFPAQRASNAENVSIWWRHHGVIQMQEIIKVWNIIWYGATKYSTRYVLYMNDISGPCIQAAVYCFRGDQTDRALAGQATYAKTTRPPFVLHVPDWPKLKLNRPCTKYWFTSVTIHARTITLNYWPPQCRTKISLNAC